MSKVRASKMRLPAGGGGFALSDLTLGVFANDQLAHRLALGTDRRIDKPLRAAEGWLLPAGAEGLCTFETELEMTMVQIDAVLLEELGANASEIRPHVGSFDPVLLSLVQQSSSFDEGGVLYRDTMQRALVAQIVHANTPTEPEMRDIADQRLARVVAQILDDPGAEHSLEVLAAEATLSPYHFSRAFKAETGLSPLQYVIKARMELAQNLLKTTALAVTEIAYRCGYSDTSRFTAHFRKRVGTTPAAFRKG